MQPPPHLRTDELVVGRAYQNTMTYNPCGLTWAIAGVDGLDSWRWLGHVLPRLGSRRRRSSSTKSSPRAPVLTAAAITTRSSLASAAAPEPVTSGSVMARASSTAIWPGVLSKLSATSSSRSTASSSGDVIARSCNTLTTRTRPGTACWGRRQARSSPGTTARHGGPGPVSVGRPGAWLSVGAVLDRFWTTGASAGSTPREHHSEGRYIHIRTVLPGQGYFA